VKANILKENQQFENAEGGIGVSSFSHNDLMNFRSRFIKNNGKIDSEGGSSGFNNYVKNNCGASEIGS